MSPISHEIHNVVLNEKEDTNKSFGIISPTLVKDIVIQISWLPIKIKNRFILHATYFNNSSENITIDYSTLNLNEPIQNFILSRQQGEKHKEMICTSVQYSYTPIVVEANIKEVVKGDISLLKFDNENEREAELIYTERKRIYNYRDES